MQTVEITNYWELIEWPEKVLKIPEIKKLIEWIKALTEHYLTSFSQDYSHLNRVIEHWGEEYEIKIV